MYLAHVFSAGLELLMSTVIQCAINTVICMDLKSSGRRVIHCSTIFITRDFEASINGVTFWLLFNSQLSTKLAHTSANRNVLSFVQETKEICRFHELCMCSKNSFNKFFAF